MRRLNPMILIAAAALLALLLVIYVFSGGSRDKPDRLEDRQAKAPRATSGEQDCGSQQTNGLIKRELFRRAAELRRGDQAAFDRLAANSPLRMESVASGGDEEGAGALNCSATITLDLPPGVSVVGGRRALTGDISYALQPSADGAGNIVTLSNAEAIITPLAALVPSGEASSEPAEAVPASDSPDEAAPAAAPAAVPAPPRPRTPPERRTEPAATPRKAPAEVTPPRRTVATAPPRRTPAPTPSRPVSSPPQEATASPSYNCRYARSGSEIAVCRNAGLASLDRQMSAQFYSAMSRGTAAQRALLQRTRSRFLAARNQCRDNDCIANTYNGRMREISDIMAGSWKPN